MTGLRVLVVEDDSMIGTLLVEMLEELGHEVCSIATTEDEAVMKAAHFKPGLMIVDVHLEEGCGVAAVDRVRATNPMACVFMTGAPEKINRPNAMILKKPFAAQALVQAIEQVAGRTG